MILKNWQKYQFSDPYKYSVNEQPTKQTKKQRATEANTHLHSMQSQ